MKCPGRDPGSYLDGDLPCGALRWQVVLIALTRQRQSGSKRSGSSRDQAAEAVDSVVIQLSPAQMHNDQRRTHLIKLLRSMGYRKTDVMF